MFSWEVVLRNGLHTLLTSCQHDAFARPTQPAASHQTMIWQHERISSRHVTRQTPACYHGALTLVILVLGNSDSLFACVHLLSLPVPDDGHVLCTEFERVQHAYVNECDHKGPLLQGSRPASATTRRLPRISAGVASTSETPSDSRVPQNVRSAPPQSALSCSWLGTGGICVCISANLSMCKSICVTIRSCATALFGQHVVSMWSRTAQDSNSKILVASIMRGMGGTHFSNRQ